MKIALVFSALVALAACGDGGHKMMPDAGQQMPEADASVDAPPDEPATLTSFVKDLITNGTSDTAQPRPYADFATLPDPDGDTNNGSAYQSLFP